MNKKNVYISLWTIVIGLPFVLAAVVINAYVAAHLTGIWGAIIGILSEPTRIGRPLVIEIIERLPEVAGMVAGMLVLMVTVWLARREQAGA